jgi:hypothetical protein
MKSLHLLVGGVLAASLAAAGCYGTTEVRGVAYTSTPSLEYVAPGVDVVADSDYPVFYSNNYYYRYDNGVWLASRYHNRGWVRAEVVPQAVLRIDRPYAYVHYHNRGVGNRRPVRVYHY